MASTLPDTAPSKPRSVPTSGVHARRKRVVNLRLLMATLAVIGIFCPSAYWWYRYQVQQTASTLLKRASAFESDQQWSKAVTSLERYILLRPDDSSARIRFVESYAYIASTNQTKRRLTALLYDVLGREPERQDLRLMLSENLLQQGEFAAAEKEARKIISSEVGDASAARRVIAISLYARARRDGVIPVREAAAALIEALADRADDVELALITADYLRMHPDAVESEEVDAATYADQIMDRMVSANPQNPAALVARYRYRRRYTLENLDDGDLERALEANPDYVEALLLVANEAFVARRGESNTKAEDYLRRAIKSQPQDPRAYLALSELFTASGEHGRAIQILRQGRALVGEDNIKLLSNLVSALIYDAELEKADHYVLELEKTVSNLSSELVSVARRRLDNRVRILHARLAFAQGKWGSAVARLKAVLASSQREQNDFQSTNFRQAMVLLAQAMTALGRWDLAAHYWDQLADRLPQQPDVLRRAANAHLKAGHPDDAIDRLERYLQASSLSPEVAIELAQAHLLRQLRRPLNERNWAEFLTVFAEAQNKAPGRWELVITQANYLLALDTGEARLRARQLLRAAESQFDQDMPFWQALVLGYEQLGELEDARRALEHYEALEPSLVNRILQRSSFLARNKRFDEAEKVLDRMLPTLGEEDRRQVQLQQVRIAVTSGQLDAAKALVSKLINASPNDEKLLKAGIEVALLTKDIDSAKRWEVSLSKLELVDNFDLRFLRARRLLAQLPDINNSERDDLTGLVTTLRSERPRWYPVVALTARHAEVRGEVKEAIRDYQWAIELGDSRSSTLERLISLLYGEGLYSEAQEYFSRLTMDQSASPRLESLAISLAIERNQVEEALELAKASVNQHPDDAMRQSWLGNLLWLNGQQTEAERVFRDAVEQFPEDQRSWYGLFTFLVRTKQTDEASQVLLTLADAVSLDETTRHFVMAQGHELLGDHKKAKKEYETAIQIAPENTAIRLRLAKLLLSMDVNAATRQFERIIELEPKSEEARRQLATLLAASGSDEGWSRAVQLLRPDEGKADVPGLTDNRLRAVLLTRRGRTREERLRNIEAARQILADQLNQAGNPAVDLDRLLLAGIYEQEALLREDPTALQAAREQLRHLVDRADPPVNYLKLYIEFLLRHIQSSLSLGTDTLQAQRIHSVFLSDARLRLEELRDAQQGDEDHREILSTLGLETRLLKAEGRTDDGATLISEFAKKRDAEIEDETQRARLYLSLGNLYSALDRHEDAELWYRQLMSITPNAYVLLTASLAKQNRVQDAVEVCLQAASDGTPSPDVAAILARLLTSSEYDGQAIEGAPQFIASAIDSHGDNVELLMSAAVLHVSRDRSEEAIHLFRRVVDLEPKNTLALNNLATLIGERPNRYAEALQYIDRAIAIAGRHPALLDTQGTIFLRAGDPEKAVSCLEEAVAGGATDSRYFLHLAAAYQQTDSLENARDALELSHARGLEDALLTKGDQELLTALEQELLASANIK